jgi:hypothetical protein
LEKRPQEYIGKLKFFSSIFCGWIRNGSRTVSMAIQNDKPKRIWRSPEPSKITWRLFK